MIQNTVQTLIDYVKDLSGQTNLANAKAIRALNFGADHLSVIKLMAGVKLTPIAQIKQMFRECPSPPLILF